MKMTKHREKVLFEVGAYGSFSLDRGVMAQNALRKMGLIDLIPSGRPHLYHWGLTDEGKRYVIENAHENTACLVPVVNTCYQCVAVVKARG